jgi:hypothetical protein
LSVNLNGNLNFGQSPVFINAQRTQNHTQGYRMGIGLNATPSAKMILGWNNGIDFNRTTYDIGSEFTQNIFNYNSDVSFKWQVIAKTFIESNLTYSLYQNDRFDFDRRVSIWNASVRRLFGPKNRLEVRLAAFDLLNQRVNINQRATQNYISTTIAPTLARYVMLSLSYNVRGYEDKVKRNDWW